MGGDGMGRLTFEGIEDAHGATGGSRVAGNLDLIGGGNGGCWLFSVRLLGYIISIDPLEHDRVHQTCDISIYRPFHPLLRDIRMRS